MAKVKYIPTLQEYAKQRRRDVVEYVEVNCAECQYCVESLNACIFGDNIRNLALLKTCPSSFK